MPNFRMLELGLFVCLFITVGPMKKLWAGGGEREKGGHVLKDTTSRGPGLCVRVRPLNTIERRGVN